MKKYIIKLVLSMAVLFAVLSCHFLDNAPDGLQTLDGIFNDKVRTEDWLSGIYNAIPDPYLFMMRNYDAYGDDFSPSEGWEAFSGWDCISKIKGNWNATSNWNADYWGNLPKRIRAGYIFLEHVKPLPGQGVSEDEVKLMKAEVRFLIAYYYYLMVNTYGAIPLQTWLSNIDEDIESLMIGQSPYDTVIDWIDKELVEAAKILPPTYTENYKYGRATSVMCLAVRARMLLFAASPLVNGNKDYEGYVNDKGEELFNTVYDPKKWEKAAVACKELIDVAHEAGYKLYYEYNDDGSIDPFMSYSNMSYVEFHNGNKEILFPRRETSYVDFENHALPRSANGQGGLGVTQSLVDAFFMSNGLSPILGYNDDGTPIINKESGYSETGFSRSDFVWKTKWIDGAQGASKANEENVVVKQGIFNMYYNREPRFYVSVLYNGAWFKPTGDYINAYYGQKDGIPVQGSIWDAPQNGYLVRKRVHPDADKSMSEKHPYRPGILYRLGEAYLNYAEALCHTDPTNPDLLTYLNLIRERAGIPIYGNDLGQIPPPTEPEELLELVKRERRVELNCEFAVRFDDIRRWKQMDLLTDKLFYGMNANGTEKSFASGNENAYFVRTPYITRRFSDKNYWLPIHQNQLDKNPNLKQLPGWQ